MIKQTTQNEIEKRKECARDIKEDLERYSKPLVPNNPRTQNLPLTIEYHTKETDLGAEPGYFSHVYKKTCVKYSPYQERFGIEISLEECSGCRLSAVQRQFREPKLLVKMDVPLSLDCLEYISSYENLSTLREEIKEAIKTSDGGKRK